MKNFLFVLLLHLLLFFSCTNQTENRQQQEENRMIQDARKAGKLLNGKAISISDGDTFKLLMEGDETIRVRLHGVDAPEKGQDYGTQAKQLLSDLIFSKNVAVIQKSKDRYGRIVGIVYADGVNVNEELLADGMVWHYTTYDKNENWAALQREARVNKRGLWSKPYPTPPWQWRKEKRSIKAEAE
jgi:micrococcal nuclease